MIKEIKPGAEQLRAEEAARLKSEALNRALTQAETKHAALDRSFQSFINRAAYVGAVLILCILAESAIIWTQAQKECAPAKTWGYQDKSQTAEPKKH
jgi:hypothetical protein